MRRGLLNYIRRRELRGELADGTPIHANAQWQCRMRLAERRVKRMT